MIRQRIVSYHTILRRGMLSRICPTERNEEIKATTCIAWKDIKKSNKEPPRNRQDYSGEIAKFLTAGGVLMVCLSE